MSNLISSFLKFFRDSISKKGTSSLSIISDTHDEFLIRFFRIFSSTRVIFSRPAFFTIAVMYPKKRVSGYPRPYRGRRRVGDEVLFVAQNPVAQQPVVADLDFALRVLEHRLEEVESALLDELDRHFGDQQQV